MKLATNAPAHWPAVTVPSWDASKTWNNAEPVAVALDRGFVAAGNPCPILIFGSRLHDEGVLEVPVQVTDNGVRYCVFLYGSGSAESAAAFAGAKRFVEADGSTRAVYYAPEPLRDVPPGNPFGPFRMRYIAQYPDEVPSGPYAMWWATPGDDNFEQSQTYRLLDDFYRACDGIESYIFRDVLNAVGAAPPGGRTALPDESVRIAIYGPEEKMLIFGASSKGLRFFFPVDSADPHYRDRLWKHVAGYAWRFKKHVEQLAGALDDEPQRKGLLYWTKAIPAVLKLSNSEGGARQFGPLHIMPEN